MEGNVYLLDWEWTTQPLHLRSNIELNIPPFLLL